MITKQEAKYTPVSPGAEQCANCAMSRMGNCTLVLGMIEPYAVCKYWEANPGDVNSVALHLAERGQNVTPGL